MEKHPNLSLSYGFYMAWSPAYSGDAFLTPKCPRHQNALSNKL